MAGSKLWFDRPLVYKDAWVGTTKDVAGAAVVDFMSGFSAAALIAWLEKLGTRSGRSPARSP